MRDCWFFGLAIDTAQFGRHHFMSCVVRFGFEDRISQEVLFFERVSETTGKQLAKFVFEKLEEKIVISPNWSRSLQMVRPI